MLKELKGLITQLGNRQLIFDYASRDGKRAALLYQYVKRTTTLSEHGAGAVLSCNAQSIILRRAAEHLEKILLDNLTMIRPGDINATDPETARLYVWKLIGIGAGQYINHQSLLLIPFLEEAFTLAEKFGLITAAKVASSLLILRTTTPHFNKEKYLYYHDKNVYYENLYLDYQLIRLSLNEIEQSISERAKTAETTLALERLAVQSQQASHKHQHPKLSLLHKFIQLRTAYASRNHGLTVQLAVEAINWVKDGPEYLRSEQSGLLIVLSEAYLLADDFENGYPYLQELLKGFNHSPRTYYKLLEMKSLLCLRTRRYEEAIGAVDELEKQYKKHPTQDKEGLMLFKAYCWFLVKLSVVSLSGKEQLSWLSRKKLEDILPNASTTANEKVQRHAQLINLIHFLAQKKYKNASAALSSLQKKERSASSPRYRYFMKMLKIVFQQSLHRVAVERHTGPVLKKLKSKSSQPAAINELEEIIPFPTLWSVLLAQLGHKRISIK